VARYRPKFKVFRKESAMADLRERKRSTNIEDRRRTSLAEALWAAANPIPAFFQRYPEVAGHKLRSIFGGEPQKLTGVFGQPQAMPGENGTPKTDPRQYSAEQARAAGYYVPESVAPKPAPRNYSGPPSGIISGSGGENSLRGDPADDTPQPFTKNGENYIQEILWNGYDANLRPEVVNVLNAAQQQLPFPIVLRSGYRDPARNKRVGGVPKSQHLSGNAVDISLNGLDDSQRAQLATALYQAGGQRLGIYKGNTGLHLDMLDQAPNEDWSASPFYPMYDKSIGNMNRAPEWFQNLAKGNAPPVPPLNIPHASPPKPATASLGLSAFRNNPAESGRFKAAQLPFPAPPRSTPGAPAGQPPTATTASLPSTGSPTNWSEFYGKFGRYGPPSSSVPQVMQPPSEIYAGFPMKPPGLGMTPQQVAGIYAGTPYQPAALVPATYTPPPMGTTFSPKGPQALAIPTNRRNTVAALSPPPVSTLQPLSTPGLTKAVEIPQARLIDHRGTGYGIAQQRAEQAMLRGRAPIAAPIVPPVVPPVGPAPIAPMPMTRPAQRPPVPLTRPQVRAPVPMIRPVPRQPVNITVRGGNVMVPTPAPRLNRPAYVPQAPVPVQQSETLRGRRGLSEGTRNNISNSGSATGTSLWNWIMNG
jgi:hypothetical protein